MLDVLWSVAHCVGGVSWLCHLMVFLQALDQHKLTYLVARVHPALLQPYISCRQAPLLHAIFSKQKTTIVCDHQDCHKTCKIQQHWSLWSCVWFSVLFCAYWSVKWIDGGSEAVQAEQYCVWDESDMMTTGETCGQLIVKHLSGQVHWCPLVRSGWVLSYLWSFEAVIACIQALDLRTVLGHLYMYITYYIYNGNFET